MKTQVEIRICKESCPFYFGSQDGMECVHPYWKAFEGCQNLIIAHENGKPGNFPEKCPLLKEELTVTYSISPYMTVPERTRDNTICAAPDGLEKPCPNCGSALACKVNPMTRVCVICGYDEEKGA